METLFDHFLITRFNIRVNEWIHDKNKSAILTDEWLEHRIMLFSNYCLPSVMAQSNKHFSWLIYLGNDTKNNYRNQLENLIKPYSNIFIRYVADQQEFINSQLTDIRTLSNKPYVITTRIDNDDCIHQNFVDRIQREFNQQNFQPVNMLKFLSLKINETNEEVKGKERLYLDFMFSNHFVSVIEKVTDQFQGCFSRKDTGWRNEKNLIQVHDDIYCLELIHSRNMLNNLDGFPFYNSSVLKEFQIKNVEKIRFDISDLFLWRMPWKKLLLSLLN